SCWLLVLLLIALRSPPSTLFPYTTLFRSGANEETMRVLRDIGSPDRAEAWVLERLARKEKIMGFGHRVYKKGDSRVPIMREFARSEEHTSELQSLAYLVCRLLLEKKNDTS